MSWSNCTLGQSISANGTSASDRVCSSCLSGQFTASNNQVTCTNWTDCLASQRIHTNGTSNSNRICEDCPDGTFSFFINSINCSAANCAVGKYVLQNGTCRECLFGKYSPSPNQLYCSQWDDCAPSTIVSKNGTTTNNRVCSDCPEDQFSPSKNSHSCINITKCPHGQFTPNGANCTNWTTAACKPGEFVSTNRTDRTDRACSQCPSGTFSTKPNAFECFVWTRCKIPVQVYSYRGNSSTDNRCSRCPPGKYARSEIEAACQWILDPSCPPGQERGSDAICRNCPNGKYSYGGTMPCQNHMEHCPAGMFMAYPGGITDDIICLACPVGTYSTVAMAECALWTPCGTNGTLRDGNTTHNNVCAMCLKKNGWISMNGACMRPPTCGPATRLGKDLRCYPCQVGYFQNTTSRTIMEMCPFQWTNCTKYQMEYASFGTRNLDSVCTPCRHGTFFNAEAQSCVTWTNCYIIYEYVSKNGTLSSDRECGNCIGNTASSKTNSPSCDTTLGALCMKMRGVNCTKQIDFPVDLEKLTSLELIPSLMLIVYIFMLLSMLGVASIYIFQRPFKSDSDEPEEKTVGVGKKKMIGKKKKQKEEIGCCTHMFEIMVHFFPFLTYFEDAQSAKDNVKGSHKHASTLKSNMANKGVKEKAQKDVANNSKSAKSVEVRVPNKTSNFVKTTSAGKNIEEAKIEGTTPVKSSSVVPKRGERQLERRATLGGSEWKRGGGQKSGGQRKRGRRGTRLGASGQKTPPTPKKTTMPAPVAQSDFSLPVPTKTLQKTKVSDNAIPSRDMPNKTNNVAKIASVGVNVGEAKSEATIAVKSSSVVPNRGERQLERPAALDASGQKRGGRRRNRRATLGGGQKRGGRKRERRGTRLGVSGQKTLKKTKKTTMPAPVAQSEFSLPKVPMKTLQKSKVSDNAKPSRDINVQSNFLLPNIPTKKRVSENAEPSMMRKLHLSFPKEVVSEEEEEETSYPKKHRCATEIDSNIC